MEQDICLRCGGSMIHIGREQLQMGKYGWLIGSWGHLLSGALSVDIYCCQDCKKLEFYAVDPVEDPTNTIARVPCPHCGELHELDDAKCPHCGKRLY